MKKLQRIGQFDLTPCNLAKLIFCQVGRLFHKTETIWYYLEKKLTVLYLATLCMKKLRRTGQFDLTTL